MAAPPPPPGPPPMLSGGKKPTGGASLTSQLKSNSLSTGDRGATAVATKSSVPTSGSHTFVFSDLQGNKGGPMSMAELLNTAPVGKVGSCGIQDLLSGTVTTTNESGWRVSKTSWSTEGRRNVRYIFCLLVTFWSTTVYPAVCGRI